MKKYKNSLVLGKMYPVTTGHLYLIDTAIEHSESVHVMVCHNPNQDMVPGGVRVEALRQIYKGNKQVVIYSIDDRDLPQYESDCQTLDEFYDYWVSLVWENIEQLDCVFTSENYGDDFARYLGIEHFLVDKERVRFPISGTRARTNPFDNWEFIPKEMRTYFIKRIVLMGPESVGKSTLSKRLSTHYNTHSVEEYGRTVFERNGNKIELDDFIDISYGRQELESIAMGLANKIIICDTEDITTYLFSKMFFPDTYQEIENILLNRITMNGKYDLYILLKPDCKGVQDGTRQFLEERNIHYGLIKKELDRYKCNYVEISGNWEERFNKSVEIIDSQFDI